MELNQSLRQFHAAVRNGKGERYSFSSYAGPPVGLNRHIMIHRSAVPGV